MRKCRRKTKTTTIHRICENYPLGERHASENDPEPTVQHTIEIPGRGQGRDWGGGKKSTANRAHLLLAGRGRPLYKCQETHITRSDGIDPAGKHVNPGGTASTKVRGGTENPDKTQSESRHSSYGDDGRIAPSEESRKRKKKKKNGKKG